MYSSQLRCCRHVIASMAGDTETHLSDYAENNNVIRQPFLIGVSGGTASGKVSTLHILSIVVCFCN